MRVFNGDIYLLNIQTYIYIIHPVYSKYFKSGVQFDESTRDPRFLTPRPLHSFYLLTIKKTEKKNNNIL